MTYRGLLFTTAIVSNLMAAGIAAAQSSSANTSASEGGSVLGEVVVTARRREENQQSVPVAITALGADALKERTIQDISGLAFTVPNLNLGSSTTTGGRKSISPAIRGVRSQAVTIYFAEVARTGGTSNGASFGAAAVSDSFYDLASVEVLKGPQGTLFGSNSTAGALTFRPQRPIYDFEGSIQGRLSNYNARGGTGVLNLPIVADRVALRLAGDFEKRDGFIKGPVQDYDDDNHYSVRASLLLDPTDRISNVTVVDIYRLNANAGSSTPIGFTPCPTPAIASSGPCLFRAPTTTTLGLPTYVDAFNAEVANGRGRSNSTDLLFQRQYSTAVSNITEVDLGAAPVVGDLTFRSILGYTLYKSKSFEDSDGLLLTMVSQRVTARSRRRSEEFQILGDNDRLTWVAGVYMSQQKLDNYLLGMSLAPISTTNPSQTLTLPETEKTVAGYVQASIELIENLKFTAGYRYTNTKVLNTLISRTGPAGTCTLAAAPGVDLAACRRVSPLDVNDPSYTFGLDYKLDDDTLLYAVTRRGFNRGGFNAQGVTPETAAYGGETLTDYEIGLKRDWDLNGLQLRTNISIFRNKYDDIQRRNSYTFCSGAGINTYVSPSAVCTQGGAPRAGNAVVNAAKATIDGVEAEVVIAPSRAFKISLAGSYLDARYNKFPLIQGGVTYDLSGNVLSQAPKWAGVVNVDYTFPEMAFGTPVLNVSYAYQTKIVFSDFNGANAILPNQADPFAFQSAYGLMNARLALKDVGGRDIEAALWVRNLFNKDYFNNKINAGAIGYVAGTMGEPRTYGVNLTYSF